MELPNVGFMGLLDPYDRVARLYPGLLALMPLPVVLVCLYGLTHPWSSALVAILSFCGGGYLLGRVSRDAGARLQERLFSKWGGAPTTQLLRFRDNTIDAITKRRYHAIIGQGLGSPLPTEQEEQTNPAEADEVYRAATAWLRERTRDTKRFPLVFKENVAYGFQRNTLGIRYYGIAIAVACVLWVLVHARVLRSPAPYVSYDQFDNLRPGEIAVMLISGVSLLVWLAFVTEDAVKRTAFAYSERLLQACDNLGSVLAATRSSAGKKTTKS